MFDEWQWQFETPGLSSASFLLYKTFLSLISSLVLEEGVTNKLMLSNLVLLAHPALLKQIEMLHLCRKWEKQKKTIIKGRFGFF